MQLLTSPINPFWEGGKIQIRYFHILSHSDLLKHRHTYTHPHTQTHTHTNTRTHARTYTSTRTHSRNIKSFLSNYVNICPSIIFWCGKITLQEVSSPTHYCNVKICFKFFLLAILFCQSGLAAICQFFFRCNTYPLSLLHIREF